MTIIGVEPGKRLYRIERGISKDHEDGYWIVWTDPNSDFSQGTFLKLYDGGKVERVTINPDLTEDIMEIKDYDRYET